MAKKLFLADIDLNKNQLIKARLENLPSHPDVYEPTDDNDPNIDQDLGLLYWSTTDKTAYFLSGYTPGTLAPIWKSLGSGSGSGVFSSDIPFSIASGKTLGKYVGGTSQTIPAAGKTFEEVLKDIALEALQPTASLSITSPQPEYNATSIDNVLSFSYTIRTAGASIAPGYPILQYKRSNSSTWIDIVGATSPYTHSFPNIADKVNGFDYQYIVQDTAGASRTVSASVAPKAYVAPTISGSVTSPVKERGDIVFSSGMSILKNSVNTTLTSYQFYVSVDGGSRIYIGSPETITTTPQPISLNITAGEAINGQTISGLKNAISIEVGVRIIDSVTTTDRSAFTRSFELKKFIGAKTSAITDYRALTVLNGGTTTYNFNPNPGRFHAIALPSGKTLTSVTTSNNETLTSNFALSSKQIPDAGGTNRTYNIYEYTSDIPFGANVTFYITMQA